MCGISGIFTLNSNFNKEIEITKIKKLLNSMNHRGPDASELLEFESGFFGHNRLSIIDLDPRANQPMACDISGNIIVFNGEIYNFKELRLNLQSVGFNFKTESDTEVILKGFLHWKHELWQRLEGFFSLAIWEKKSDELYLVRDPLGVKPLYYCIDQNSISFSSELKPLVRSGLVPLELDMQAISDYLTYSYVCSPRTPIKNVKQVDSATVIRFSKLKGIQIRRYWKIEYKENVIDANDINLVLYQYLKKSVDKSLISDVPIGLLLSSGLDSNIIYNLIEKKESLYTLTASFSDSNFDEGGLVREIYKNEQNHKFINVGNENLLEDYGKMYSKLDTLNANTAAFPEMKIFEKVNLDAYKVMLTGSGLDEIFGGYITYKASYINNFYRFVPNRLRNIVESPLKMLIKSSDTKYPLRFMVDRFSEGVSHDIVRAHVWWRSVFTPSDKISLFSRDVLNSGPDLDFTSIDSYRQSYDLYEGFDYLSRLMLADLQRFLIDNANILMDNLSMAHSVEVRPPFLNKELIEFTMRLPVNYRMSLFNSKKLLRDSVRQDLPHKVISGKKSGLVAPQAEWFRNDLRPLLDEVKNEFDSYLPFFSCARVVEIFDEHLFKGRNNSLQISTILTLYNWIKSF